MLRACWLAPFLLLALAVTAPAADGNRLAYLDECDPYYVSRRFPKLVTPQWVGEPGVEAVVILAIDDMRGHEKWETFLRPILNRLKQIDGRAPVSIMTCQIDPKHPNLQTWLKEGLSLETHTIDHPCPFWRVGSLEKAKDTYDRCIDLLNDVPGNKPVAFRMPCCDSLNTPSPRFYAEIFNKTTPKGNYLSIDSSVFHVFTSNDPELPRELVIDPDGQDKFLKYLPRDRSFVNYVEDYPYPYVIDRLCWEFPCMTPSDWQAQHLQKPNNPLTVRDWKAALDATVIKQGVFTMVFHPHGWIKAEQIIDLIDHAVAKHGKKVKFLTFREAQERLEKNLTKKHSLRDREGRDNLVRLLDVDNDGYVDVVIGNEQEKRTRVWSRLSRAWLETGLPTAVAEEAHNGEFQFTTHFGVLQPAGNASLIKVYGGLSRLWHFTNSRWEKAREWPMPHPEDSWWFTFSSTVDQREVDRSTRFLDLDGDGCCELVISHPDQQIILKWEPRSSAWKALPFKLPAGATLVDDSGAMMGVRFIDLDQDGRLDVIFSNENASGVYLFQSFAELGWGRRVAGGPTADAYHLSRFSETRGSRPWQMRINSGAWFHSRSLWVSNENTHLLKDHVDRRSFNDLLKDVQPTAKTSEASLRSIQTRPGFQVELMAAEPLLEDPIAFAFGADGKLWVVEMGDYPLGIDGKGKHGGKVKFLESTKGDGKYDKATVFLDGLGYPTGVMPWRKGVLVACAPDIIYAEDTDGDGKADKRVVVFTGFAQGNQQHRVNGLAWGLDNWVYLANGDSGGSIRLVNPLTPGAVPPKRVQAEKVGVGFRGRDLRFKPDTGELEMVTGPTQYGRCRDDWGNWFGGNNSVPMWHFVLDDHYLCRNPHYAAPEPRIEVPAIPGAAPVYPISRTLPRFNDFHTANRFTSACSPIVYCDDLFGPHFAGNSFVCEPVHNLIHREVMTPSGVTFKSQRFLDEQTSEFLASSDNWFRPTMVKTGPDGALWVCDMYRHVIEHPEWIPKEWQKKLDLRAGHDMGRIYRVFPVGKTPRPIPRLDKLDTAGLVAALDGPSGWQRDMAQQLLVERQDKKAVPLLSNMARTSTRPLAKLHALCTLDGLQATDAQLLEHALKDAEPGVRRHAVRLAEPLFAKSPELAQAVAKLIDDPDPQVRLQVAYSLGEWNDPQAGAGLGKLALRDGGDRYVLAAVMSSVKSSNLESLLGTILASLQTGSPSAALLESVLRISSGLGETKALSTLLSAVGTPDKGTYAHWQYIALAGLLDVFDQRNTPLATMTNNDNGTLRPALERLAGLFEQSRRAVASPASSVPDRVLAARLLGRGMDRQAEDVKLLLGLLTPQSADELQVAAVAALGRLRDTQIAVQLLSGWKGYGPGLRAQILEVLGRRDAWLPALLDALEKKEILALEIDPARRQALLAHRLPAIKNRASKLFASQVDADRQKVIDQYQSVLGMKGDAVRGTAIFVKTCATCHRHAGVGQQVGPDIASIGDKSPEGLLIAILDPNRAIESRYLNYVAQTRNGLTFSGVLTSETATSVTLASSDGKQQVILRTDLEELTSTGKSAMPEGVEKDLQPQDVADLIAHLRTGVAPLERRIYAGNKPEVVHMGTDGSFKLPATGAEIYGNNLMFEEKYQNLGFWRSQNDHAVWTIDVPIAGTYDVWLDAACAGGGNQFIVQAGLQQLTGTVAGTGSWDVYRDQRAGTLALPAGQVRLTIRPAGRMRGYLIDLRTIRLVRSK